MLKLDRDSKFLIIGAGISGLALAQILRRHGIAFEIFERDRDDGARRQGWTLGLDECLPSLGRLLPTDIDDITRASVNQTAGKHDSLLFINGANGQELGVIGRGFGDSIMAERNTLRKMWLQHLDVRFNKHLVGYDMTSDGISVRFEDGSITHGTILVACDGSNSKVRSQLLRGFQAETSKAIMLNGDVALSKDQWQPLVNKANNGVLFGQPGLKGTMLLGERLPNDRARFHWDCAHLGGDSKANHLWADRASERELYEKAVQLTKHLPAYIANVIQLTGPEGMNKPPIKLMETVLPVDKLPVGPVTLVGDAAHSMVPFRGMGANTALLDVCDLADALIAGVEARASVEEVLRSYEAQIIPRGRTKVLESRAEAESSSSYDVSGGRIEKSKMTMAA